MSGTVKFAALFFRQTNFHLSDEMRFEVQTASLIVCTASVATLTIVAVYNSYTQSQIRLLKKKEARNKIVLGALVAGAGILKAYMSLPPVPPVPPVPSTPPPPPSPLDSFLASELMHKKKLRGKRERRGIRGS